MARVQKTFLRKVERRAYTVVANPIFEEEDISFKAVGLFCYLLSLPNDWVINMTHLSRVHSDGPSAVRSGLEELIRAGYVRRVQRRDSKGQIVRWEIQVRETLDIPWDHPDSDNPDSDNPDVDNPDVDNPDVDNRTLLNTNSTKYSDVQSTKDKDSSASRIWEAYVDSVKSTIPSARGPRYNRARRDLIVRRLKDFTEEELILAVTGWTKSKFHCGDNEHNKYYNSIELILRDAAHIEQFMGYHDTKAKPNKRNYDDFWDD